MKTKNKVATLKDIASQLGLSANTVSKALNNKSGVNEETRKKVREKAKELNYIPNVIAKSLRLSNTKTIGVIVSDSSYSFFAKIIKGIEEKATKMGYNIILCNTNKDYEREKRAVELLVSKRIDGIILAATMLTKSKDVEYIRSFNTPFIFLSRGSQDYDVDYVSNDNILGAYMITDYLIKKGCRRIHFLNLAEDRPIGQDRLIGFKKACKDNSIEPDLSLVSYVEPDNIKGYERMKEILDRGEHVETVFCGCDVIAIGAMQAILEKGFKIPEDIKVVGYDDIDYAADLRVPLTTIRQPKYDIGSIGAELLINKIIYNKNEIKHIILKPELIIRQSG